MWQECCQPMGYIVTNVTVHMMTEKKHIVVVKCKRARMDCMAYSIVLWDIVLLLQVPCEVVNTLLNLIQLICCDKIRSRNLTA